MNSPSSATGAWEPLSLPQARLYCRQVLPQVSRTFAIGVSCLPDSLREAVGNAYLICRIADTIEDDPALPLAQKSRLFDLFMHTLNTTQDLDAYTAEAQAVGGDAAHVSLVAHTQSVLAVFHGLPRTQRAIVRTWALEMIRGMKAFCERYPAGLRIQTLPEYKRYCYFVAGTVGHMLTDLWISDFQSALSPSTRRHLRSRSEAFGEGLQTINIVKDIAWDALNENNFYIPEDVLVAQGSSHSQLLNPEFSDQSFQGVASLLELAQNDLHDALEYVCYLPKLAHGIRLFTGLPLVFAYATLRELKRDRRMLNPQLKVKISRGEVKSLVVGCRALGWSNTALRWMCRRALGGSVG